MIEIIRLESCDSPVFKQICEWYYHWLGIRNGESMDEITCTMQHSLNTNTRLPQTFVALIDGNPAGMYQLAIADDLYSRPDLYPWLINVYVDEKYRRMRVCKTLMNTVQDNARSAHLSELYLYTTHIGLYEKYGWHFVENVRTFKADSPVERLYHLNISLEH